MIQSGVTQPVSILNQRCEFRMEQFEQINHESEGLKKEKRKGRPFQKSSSFPSRK